MPVVFASLALDERGGIVSKRMRRAGAVVDPPKLLDAFKSLETGVSVTLEKFHTLRVTKMSAGSIS
jgi:hypothetical protein